MRPPVLVTSATDIAAVLRGDREALGISGEEMDARIGWAERYTAKAESPHKTWGRKLFWVEPMADIWMIGLNRALVLMDRDEAERLIREHAGSLGETRGLQRKTVVRVAFS